MGGRHGRLKTGIGISILIQKTDRPILYIVKWFQSAMFTLLMWLPYAYGDHKVFLENKKTKKAAGALLF